MQKSERREATRELVRLAAVMVHGSLSQTTRTCGNAGCRCHRGERHGPHTYLNYRTGQGKATGMYVPPVDVDDVSSRVAAWKRFQELAELIAVDNRESVAKARSIGSAGTGHARPA